MTLTEAIITRAEAWAAQDAAYSAWRRARALHLEADGLAAALMERYRQSGSDRDYAVWHRAERRAIRRSVARAEARERQEATYSVAYQSGPLA
jgi:hypothetical protein